MTKKRGANTKYRHEVDWPELIAMYQQPSRRRVGVQMSATEVWDFAKKKYHLGDRTTFIGHFRGHLAEAGVHYRSHAESRPGRPPAVERMNASEWTWAFEFGHPVKEGKQ
jgi:hypothetical protein